MIVFLSGLLAGLLHVVSGPDHLAAIAPLTVRTPRAASTLGAAWGIGHGGGIALWFAVAALVRTQFGIQPAPAALEALVGASLIALGLINYGERHAPHDAPHAGPMLAFLFGVLHGSAGATHLLALLPTLGLPAQGVLGYAAGYLCAGILAMAAAASLLGRFTTRAADVGALRRVCSLAATTLGAFWLLSSLASLV